MVSWSAGRGLPDGVTAARGLSLTRAVIGAGLLLRPVQVARLLGADHDAATRMAWAVRMAGGRDLVVALGTLAAGPAGRTLWLLAGVASDGTDAVVFSRAAAEGHLGRVRGALAAVSGAGAAAAGAILSAFGDRGTPTR